MCRSLPSGVVDGTFIPSSVAIGLTAQGKGERGFLGGGIQPDTAAEVLDDLAAHGQADAGTRVGAALVEALEQPEDPLRVLAVDADAMIGDGEPPVGTIAGGPDHDPWFGAAAELDRVAQEVLEHGDQQRKLR